MLYFCADDRSQSPTYVSELLARKPAGLLFGVRERSHEIGNHPLCDPTEVGELVREFSGSRCTLWYAACRCCPVHDEQSLGRYIEHAA